jgi:hypothetical protein
MRDYVVRVFKKIPGEGQSYPICDIKMSGQLTIPSTTFARQHGGDFLVILTLDEYEEEHGDLDSI